MQPTRATIVPVTLDRVRRAALIACAVLVGAATAPVPAAADGPGYGGKANALTVRWRSANRAAGLRVYACGFRGGSPVRVRVGSQAERTVAADPSGAVDVLVGRSATSLTKVTSTALIATTATAGSVSPGTSVLVAGHTPGGELRTLVGSVPPQSAGIGAAGLVPYAGAVVVAGVAAVWYRRRFGAATAAQMQRYRHNARHSA